MLDFLLREYRRHRMARFTVWVLAYGVALWLVNRFSGGVPGFLWFLFWAAAVPAAAYYVFRLGGVLRRHLLWHLRRRLILTYFFVAVVPIGLILLLIGIAAFILNGQFASFLVVSKLQDRAGSLQQLTLLIGRHAQHSAQRTPQALFDDLDTFIISEIEGQGTDFPGLEVTLRAGSFTRAFRVPGDAPTAPVSLPSWLKRDRFGGIVLDGNRLVLRAANRIHTPAGELAVIISEPFSPELLDQVGAGIGPVTVEIGASSRTDARLNVPAPESGPVSSGRDARASVGSLSGQAQSRLSGSTGPAVEASPTRSRSLQVPPPVNALDYEVYSIASLQPYVWGGTEEHRAIDAGFFEVTSRIFAVFRQVLSTLGQYSGLWWTAFAVVGVVFLVIELVSLVISWRLTRSITTTIDKLNEATEHVKTGDFSHRINLPAYDQLTALGEAFDGMTASVERLLRESLEKTKIDGELEIAREVQSRLFPESAPDVSGLRLYGLCKPARSVSGDYYDFLRLGPGRVALVVGDISGKGISAALLMATLQAALHAQFYDGQITGGERLAWPGRTADVVSRLNRQIYASTPREKYITLFYGVYDAGTRKLTYTNAGHLPPVVFRRNRLLRLEGGGTVVGLFPSVRYEQVEIQIEPGDLLLAFTDGMTEPENSYGEEFGEERLLDVAQRARDAPPQALMEEIYRRVSDWTGSPELQDDMTLVVGQAGV
ncbi:MAG TPA: SpoIIE family protein phosphatase [Terriglobia bacterium]|nr:SpoIIE family protein phosphatase [Terriglobia bacterium]